MNLHVLSTLLFCLMAILPSALGQTPSFVPDDGLVGWYPFNGDAEDLGPLQMDGMAYNVLWSEDRLGNSGSALDLSQSAGDYVDLPSEIDLEFDSTLTLSMWVNYPPVPNQKLFHQGPNPGNYDQIGILTSSVASSGDMSIRLYTENSSYASYSYPEAEDWKHLVFVVDGSTFAIYVNGEQVQTGSLMAWSNTYGTVRIGQNIFGGSENYLGVMDDLGLWNRALSAEEIEGIYAEIPIVEGCTDALACNFNPDSNTEDGSCAYSGCNDQAACNFNGLDVCDVDCIYPAVGENCVGGEGLCGPGTFWNANAQMCEVSLVGDTDSDGCVTTSDLLNMLSVFGLCIDLGGQSFACGVDHVTFDGHDYSTVQIGGDCWFSENLRTTIYANGDSISQALLGGQWFDFLVAHEPGVTALGYDSTEVVDSKGLWYNGYAAYDSRNVCPSGWHVSTELDWVNMEVGLGSTTSYHWPLEGQIDDIHVHLQADNDGWSAGTNSSGFGAVQAGYISSHESNPGSHGFQSYAMFFSVIAGVQNDPLDGIRRRRFEDNLINVDSTGMGNGLSIRCVQNAD